MDELEQIREQNRWNPDKKEERQEKPKSSLPKNTVVMMTVTALFFDAVQAILTIFGIGLVISPFISIFAGFVFFLWFMMHGISIVTPKRLLTMGGGWVAELIPAIDALPAWTAAVWYTISTTKVLETVEKLPGGKVAGFAVLSQMAGINASRKSQIDNTYISGRTQFRSGGRQYEGTKDFKVQSLEEMRKESLLSPEQRRQREAVKAYTGWKTQMTDIDKMRGVKRKYADPEEDPENGAQGDKNGENKKDPQSANKGNVLSMDPKNPQQITAQNPQKQPITLAGENEKWKKELAQLEPELMQKHQAYEEADQKGREMAKYLSEHGSIKGEAREKELLKAHDKGMAPHSEEITKISNRVSDLKQMIYSSNHKLSEQNSTPKPTGISKAA